MSARGDAVGERVVLAAVVVVLALIAFGWLA